MLRAPPSLLSCRALSLRSIAVTCFPTKRDWPLHFPGNRPGTWWIHRRRLGGRRYDLHGNRNPLRGSRSKLPTKSGVNAAAVCRRGSTSSSQTCVLKDAISSSSAVSPASTYRTAAGHRFRRPKIARHFQRLLEFGSYKAGNARKEDDGSLTRALSPAATAPAALTTPSTPHLNGGPVSADESTCRFKPAWKRSMRTHGVRRPVSSTIAAGPSSMSVPSGIRSRSRPAVVMFSPRSPARTLKPASEREAKSSDGIR